MMSYINLDIESSNKSHASGIITGMQIKMNNISNVRDAVIEARNIYDVINEKLEESKGETEINR